MSEDDEHLCRNTAADIPENMALEVRIHLEICSTRSVVAPDDTSADGRACRTREPQRAGDPTLTRRELEVLRELALGMSNLEIANRLFISENTVKYHVHSILEKLDLSDRRDAANYAREHGLIKQG
jgi:DNA-binding NarL/FixJ family response regulator